MQLYDIDLRDNIFRHAKAHFQFESNGHRIAFAYIRKNACSAFKNFIIETSPHKAPYSQRGEDIRPIDFLRTHHGIKTHEAIDGCDVRLFVYRDPFQRITSLFLNKLVVQSNAEDFLAALEQSGHTPNDLTFSSFIELYVRHPFKKKDPHLVPQAAHLLPIHYTHCIPIHALKERLVPIVGQDTANTFFGKPINATPSGIEMGDCSAVCVSELRQRYLDHNTLPGSTSFETVQNLEHIKRVYDQDYRLIDNITRSSE